MRLGRERLLAGGNTGTGKTFAILTVVRYIVAKGINCVLIELDDGSGKCLDEFPELKDNPRFIRIPNCITFMNLYGALGQVDELIKKGLLNADSWVITEGVDILGTRIRHEMADITNNKEDKSITGASIANGKYEGLQPSSWASFLDKRKVGKPILEPSDYDAIYTELEKALTFLAFQMPCNWYATTDMVPLRTQGQYLDAPDVVSFYQSLGMTSKYDCYKFIPRWCDSLIETGRNVQGNYTFKIWKDRGHPVPLQPQVHKDFYQDFFVNYAKVGQMI